MARAIDHASRGHALLGPSGAHRWLNCPASARIEEGYPDATSEWAQEGTLAHEEAEAYVRSEVIGEADVRYPEAADADMARHAEEYAAFIRELASEDGATVMVEQRLDLARWIPEGFGTADCVLLGDDRLAVVDYKYGKGVKVEAEGNPQMRIYALGALAAFEDVCDPTRVEMYIYQPRLGHVGKDEMTVAELTGWAECDLVPAAELAYAGGGDCAPGDWCRFCKAAGECSALTEYSTELVSADFEDEDAKLMTDAQMAEALDRLDAVKAWCNAVEKAARESILDGTRSVPGWKVVEGRSVRRLTDPDRVAELLENDGIDPAMLYERKLVSLTAMEKLAGKKRFNELAGEYVEKPKGKPTLARASDRRQEYGSADDFDAE